MIFSRISCRKSSVNRRTMVQSWIQKKKSNYPRGGCVAGATFTLRRSVEKTLFSLRSLSSRWFAFGLGEEFLGLDFVAATIDWGDIIIFAEEIDEHGKILIVHDDD